MKKRCRISQDGASTAGTFPCPSAIDRRDFLKTTIAGMAAASFVSAESEAAEAQSSNVQGIIDTNVNLFDWPFRTLKYRETGALVSKLKKHRVVEAWAGSFEALLSKDIDGLNERLAAECRKHSGFLRPFGSVNLAWPDWEEDVRRCHEVHQMPGLRIYPGYQPFNLDHPRMASLVKMTSERGLILQIVLGMEDPRVHHPIIELTPVTLNPLLGVLKGLPGAKIQLLHFPGAASESFSRFVKESNTFIEISRLEGNGAVGRMIGSVKGLPSALAPLDRIMFGSHAPYFPLETAILKLIESPLDPEQLQAIMNGNARRLLPKA